MHPKVSKPKPPPASASPPKHNIYWLASQIEHDIIAFQAELDAVAQANHRQLWQSLKPGDTIVLPPGHHVEWLPLVYFTGLDEA